MTSMILKGLFETLLMTVASSFFSYLIGIPLGVRDGVAVLLELVLGEPPPGVPAHPGLKTD